MNAIISYSARNVGIHFEGSDTRRYRARLFESRDTEGVAKDK
jgi:hypothetical protein